MGKDCILDSYDVHDVFLLPFCPDRSIVDTTRTKDIDLKSEWTEMSREMDPFLYISWRLS